MNARALVIVSLAALGVLGATRAYGGDVKVAFKDGRVTVIAKDATPREILEAWGRLGHVTLVNPERLSGAPVTLELIDLPEAKALKTILRGSAGYIAAERGGDASVASASRYDRILLMSGAAPTITASAAPASTASASPAAAAAVPSSPAPGPRSFGPPARVQAADDAAGGFAPPPRPQSEQGGPQGRGFPAQPGYAGVTWTAPAPTHSPVAVSPTAGADYANAPQLRPQPKAATPAAGTAVTGSAVPGVITAQPVLPSTRYTGDLPTSTMPQIAAASGGSSATAATVPGAAQPGVTTPTPSTSTSTFKNPYGVPDAPLPTTVVPQNANPYGLPARTTTQDSTVTPIIKSGDPGGN